MKNLIKGSLCFLFFLAILFQTLITSCAKEDHTLKVGWFTLPGCQYTDDQGNKKGYCYDYYQEVSRYTGFSYEYVPGSWAECVERLKSGEIDILSFVQYTPERAKYLDYTNSHIGQNYATLTASIDDFTITENTYPTFEGKTIGVMRDTNQTTQLLEFMKTKEFSCAIKEYDEVADLELALEQKEIDMILHNSFRIIGNEERIVAQFSPERVYLAVKKGNTELLNTLNDALTFIRIYEPTLDVTLMQTYFSTNTAKLLILTPEEKEFLNSKKKLRFIIPPYAAFSAQEKEDGKHGIFMDIIEALTNTLGIQSEYLEPKNYEEFQEMIADEKNDVICGFLYDYGRAEEKEMLISVPFMKLSYDRIYNKNYVPSLRTSPTIALCSANYFKKEYIEKEYPNSKVLWYQTLEECFDAIVKEEVDFTFCDSFSADYYLRDYHYNGLIGSLVPVNQSLCFASSKENSYLLSSILSKAIFSVGESEIEKIISNNSNAKEDNSILRAAIYSNPIQSFSLLAVFTVFVIIAFVLFYLYRVNRHKREALEVANAAKINFLSHMSHEMRTPLNGMKGMLELLKDSPDYKENTYIDNALVSVQHLSGLINDILDMSKIENGQITLKKDLYSMKELITQINAIIAPLAQEKKINFSNTVDKVDAKYINVDAGRLKQILINLLSNAVQYTDIGGSVSYHIEGEPLEGNQLQLTFRIIDNGSGMSKEFMKDAFRSFEQGKAAGLQNGSGLGLPITKELIELMGGAMQVMSEVGKGTTFLFSIVVEKSNAGNTFLNAERVLNLMQNFNSLHFEGKHALAVDDNDINLSILECLLSAIGFSVTIAHDGEEAVQKFSSSEFDYYDIIFMDIMMPKMDGLEATKEIRKLGRPDASFVPIVAVTANAFADDVHKSLESGMNYHLSKPLERVELQKLLIQEFFC